MSKLRKSILILFGFSIIAWSGCVMVDLGSVFSRDLDEIVLFEDEGWGVTDKVLMVDLSGVIMSDPSSGFFGSKTASPFYIKAVLNKAKEDPNIKAILLRINSPGGSIAPTDLIAHELKTFAEETDIPLYAHIMDVGASGGYYAAVVADKIYAEPSAITGSIGVILVLPKLKDLAEKVGYDQVVIKSGKMKDLGNAFRDLSDEERDVFESMIQSMYNRFLDTIVSNRPTIKDRAQLKPIADGRVYTADQARKNGLIDKVAHLDEALKDLKAAAKIKKADVVTYGYKSNPDANLYSLAGSAPKHPFSINLPPLQRFSRAGWYYLWMPGS